MTFKKLFFSVCLLALTSVAFAFPAPTDTIPLLEPYTNQIEQLNKTLDQQVLPPLKGLLTIAKEFGNSTQDDLTPEQEQLWNKHQAQLTTAFMDMVSPVVEQVDMKQVNELFKQIATSTGQPAKEITKQEFTDMLIGMIALTALAHFQETKQLTQEELELATILFFPQHNEEFEQE